MKKFLLILIALILMVSMVSAKLIISGQKPIKTSEPSVWGSSEEECLKPVVLSEPGVGRLSSSDVDAKNPVSFGSGTEVIVFAYIWGNKPVNFGGDNVIRFSDVDAATPVQIDEDPVDDAKPIIEPWGTWM